MIKIFKIQSVDCVIKFKVTKQMYLIKYLTSPFWIVSKQLLYH